MPEAAPNIPDDLPPRAHMPEGFSVETFTRAPDRPIRFGHVAPQSSQKPRATVIILPGLSEYMEKYYEVMHDLLDKNLEVWSLDWMGQGGSGRYLSNLSKRHASRFQDDIDDLHHLIENHIKPAAFDAQGKRLPLVILGHSMGGHLGMRYMAQHPGTIKCAGFSAPMTGLLAVRHIPAPVLYGMESFVEMFFPEFYATPQHDWNENAKQELGINVFSRDIKRAPIHMAWMKANPSLRIGGATYRFVVEALKSCRSLQTEFKKIAEPCVIGLAGEETLVDNNPARALAASSPQMRLIEFPDSLHEILMETDPIRGKFMNEFFTLLDHYGLNEPDNLPG